MFSLLCGFAPNIEWLIAFRAGQGLGGAALLTISLAIVLGAFPKRQQGTAVGIWGALGTAAAAVGPVLGGVLVTYGHWSWIFFVNVPIGIVAVIACARIIPRGERKERAEGGIDIPGMVISGAGLFCLTLALVEGDTWGWTSATIIALFVAAIVSFPLFMWWETSTSSPMFPVNLLRIRSFTAANSAVMFVGLAMGGTFLMLVLFLVSVLGYSELRAAIALTIMPVLALIVAPNAGRLNDRIGPRFPAAAGAACFAIGLALLAQLGGETHALGRDVAGGLHRRRHGPRDADPLGRLDGVAAAAGARRGLRLAQHDAAGRLHRRRGPARRHLHAHGGAERAAGDEDVGRGDREDRPQPLP